MAVKRAIRRLKRLADGTVGIKYIDLDTLLEVTDLSGYQVINTGSDTPPPSNDNSDDKEVEINPPSGGSTEKGLSGADGDRANYISGSKNPAIAKYLSETTPAARAPEIISPYDEESGVTVTPDEEVADAEWADAERQVPAGFNPDIGIAPTGNVYDESGSVLTGINPNEFDKNIMGLNAEMRDAKLDSREELENIKDLSAGIYTAAQENIASGATPDFTQDTPSYSKPSLGGNPVGAARPELPASGLPAASALSGASRSTAGKVRQGTTVAGRPETPIGTNTSTTPAANPGRGISQGGPSLAPVAAPRDAVNAGIAGAGRLPGANVPGGGFGLVDAHLDNVDKAAQPDPSRFEGGFGKPSVGQQVSQGVSKTSPLGEMEMAKDINTRDTFASVRPGVPGTPNGTMANTATKPATMTPAGGRTGFAGAPMAAPTAAKTTPAPEVGKTKNMTDIFGIGSPEDVSTAQNTINKVSASEVSRMSPARAATLGMVQRTPAEKAAIGKMMAGELSATTMDNLYSADEASRNVARQEFANVMTTVENRAASRMFGSLENALDPSQYNSLMEANMPTTNANYNKYSKTLTEAMNAYYSGQFTPTSYDLTSYYNPDLVTPGWANEMANAQRVGFHTFGSLPEYGPNQGFAQKAQNANRTLNYTGTGTGSDTPSERNAASRTQASFGEGGSRGVASGIGRNDNAGAGRGSSPGGPSLGSSGSGSDRGSVGRNDSAGAGRGSSMGGPGIGSSAGAGPGRGSSPGGPSMGKSSSSGTSRGATGIGGVGLGAGSSAGGRRVD